MNKESKNKLMDTENKLVATKWEEGWGLNWRLGEKGEGMKICKLPAIKTVTGM